MSDSDSILSDFCWWDVLDGRLAWAALAKVLLALREQAWGAAQWSGCWRECWLCWLRCVGWAGGSRDGKAPGLSGCLDCVEMQL